MVAMRHDVLIGIAGVWLILAGAAPALAEERRVCPLCAKANDQTATYSEKAGHTLARGLLNFTLGWTEMISQPAKEARDGHHVLTGIGKGLRHTATRTLAGVGEVLTFWTPKVKDTYIHFSTDCPLDNSR